MEATSKRKRSAIQGYHNGEAHCQTEKQQRQQFVAILRGENGLENCIFRSWAAAKRFLSSEGNDKEICSNNRYLLCDTLEEAADFAFRGGENKISHQDFSDSFITSDSAIDKNQDIQSLSQKRQDLFLHNLPDDVIRNILTFQHSFSDESKEAIEGKEYFEKEKTNSDCAKSDLWKISKLFKTFGMTSKANQIHCMRFLQQHPLLFDMDLFDDRHIDMCLWLVWKGVRIDEISFESDNWWDGTSEEKNTLLRLYISMVKLLIARGCISSLKILRLETLYQRPEPSEMRMPLFLMDDFLPIAKQFSHSLVTLGLQFESDRSDEDEDADEDEENVERDCKGTIVHYVEAIERMPNLERLDFSIFCRFAGQIQLLSASLKFLSINSHISYIMRPPKLPMLEGFRVATDFRRLRCLQNVLIILKACSETLREIIIEDTNFLYGEDEVMQGEGTSYNLFLLEEALNCVPNLKRLQLQGDYHSRLNLSIQSSSLQVIEFIAEDEVESRDMRCDIKCPMLKKLVYGVLESKLDEGTLEIIERHSQTLETLTLPFVDEHSDIDRLCKCISSMPNLKILIIQSQHEELDHKVAFSSSSLESLDIDFDCAFEIKCPKLRSFEIKGICSMHLL